MNQRYNSTKTSGPAETHNSSRRLILKSGIAAITAALGAPGTAQNMYPSKPIKIIVPFGPGTGLDIVARGLSQELSKQMGVAVTVENREGAGGTIGTMAVQNAAPDGSTLLLNANPPFAVEPLLRQKPVYDPMRDFTPVARLGSVAMALITPGNSRFSNFAQAAEFAERNPGKLTYAHTGVNGPSFLGMERLKKARDIRILDVPYKSTTQAMADTISGVVDFNLPSLPAALPFAQSGQIKIMAVGYAQRSSTMPDIPTMAEVLNRPGFESTVWYAVLGPAGMSPAIAERLNTELAKAMTSTSMASVLAKLSIHPAHLGPKGLSSLIALETDNYRKLLDELGVKKD